MRYASYLDGHQPDFHRTAHIESCSPWIMPSDPPNQHCHLSDMIIFETSQQISLLMCAQMLDLIQLSTTFWHNINADVRRYADHSSSASIQRCTGTLLHPQDTFPRQTLSLTWSIMILLDPFLLQKTTCIYSLMFTRLLLAIPLPDTSTVNHTSLSWVG